MTMDSKITKEWVFENATVIVAHPDDETLWAGGTILMHPETQWTILTLCRRSDPDRSPKFDKAMNTIEAIRDGKPPIRARERFDVSVFKQLGDGDVVVLEEDVLKQEIYQRYRMAILLLSAVAAVSLLLALSSYTK